MKFSEIVKEASALLQDSGRITYRALKREFDLDDDALEDLKAELIKARKVGRDEDGEILVWIADGSQTSIQSDTQPSSQPPASYTPSHLAERIRAEQAAMESRGAADGERKTITALFADLKGSTALIEPEFGIRDLLSRYNETGLYEQSSSAPTSSASSSSP